jgi:hypothetical protein
LKTFQDTVKPLFDAGKEGEAEAAQDRLPAEAPIETLQPKYVTNWSPIPANRFGHESKQVYCMPAINRS